MDPFAKHLPRAVPLAHHIVRSRLSSGDVAVDATVGNGHDTLFLANIVGPEGYVAGFDIQQSAIESTQQKTADHPQVALFHAGHEELDKHLTKDPLVAMFNLGYLPGADKDVITRQDTTIAALRQIAARLLKNGVITIVLYTGHEGGPEEADAIREWCGNLDQTEFSVAEYGFVNQRNSPPSLIAIERK